MITVDRNIFTSLLAMPDRIFVRQEALRVGVRDEALIAGVRRGSIARLCRGAYTAPGPRTTEQHRRLLARAGLRLYPDAALMGGTAVAAHGIPLFEVPSAPADPARPIAREAKAKGLRFRPLRHAIVTTQWGPATDPATSLVQLTMDHGVLPGVASIDAALHSRAVERDALESAFDRVEGWPCQSPCAVRPRVVRPEGRVPR
uniref:Uncharacterized protein n=1 Tax=Janibacter limosus TaxID=53458 RepID=A0AC61U7R4_9MICO|nr:hypothetical protein [Janibacter limosus]